MTRSWLVVRTFPAIQSATAAVLAVFLAWVAAAEPAPAPAVSAGESGPRIRFAETVYDFGKVVSGEVVHHDFAFTNSGDSLLVISEVRSTCGCIQATNSSPRVEPGKEGRVHVELLTGNFNSPVSHNVTVLSNDTNCPATNLQMKGTVWRPIEVTPLAAAFLGALEAPSNALRVLHIVNKQSAPLTLSEPRSNHRAIAAELRTNQPGREYELLVKLVPPLGRGNIFGELTMQTSATNMPVIKVPVWAVRSGK